MIDDGVGRILDALKRSGFADNTIVIFTTDHGEYLGAHGLLHKGPASYRQLTEVPMLMKGPGIAAGLEVNSLTSHIDFMPTLLEMTGRLSEASSYDGLSLIPLLSGETKSIREYTFGEYHPTVHSDLYNQTVYTDKWRYTIYPEMPDWGELFDLENDPSERQNLFIEPGVDHLKRELGEILAQKFPPQPSVENKVLCKW
jgi:arylsulfatase